MIITGKPAGFTCLNQGFTSMQRERHERQSEQTTDRREDGSFVSQCEEQVRVLLGDDVTELFDAVGGCGVVQSNHVRVFEFVAKRTLERVPTRVAAVEFRDHDRCVAAVA